MFLNIVSLDNKCGIRPYWCLSIYGRTQSSLQYWAKKNNSAIKGQWWHLRERYDDTWLINHRNCETFLDTQVSLAPTHVSPLVGHTFEFPLPLNISVQQLSLMLLRCMKALMVENVYEGLNAQKCMLCSKYIYPKSIFAKYTQLACLPNFAVLFLLFVSTAKRCSSSQSVPGSSPSHPIPSAYSFGCSNLL